MELEDVMRTTFAARAFTDEDLPDSALRRILEVARFAPSGGNRQAWHVIALRDRATRTRLAELALPAMQRYVAQVKKGESPWNTVVPSGVTAEDIANSGIDIGFTHWIVRAPVALLVCVDLSRVTSFDSGLDRIGVISGASIYPFVWNLLLAARDQGWGGTLTTFLAPAEPEVRALLGIPARFAVAALVPLGRPQKQLTRLRRAPVDAFTTCERFDGALLAGAPADGAG